MDGRDTCGLMRGCVWAGVRNQTRDSPRLRAGFMQEPEMAKPEPEMAKPAKYHTVMVKPTAMGALLCWEWKPEPKGM